MTRAERRGLGLLFGASLVIKLIPVVLPDLVAFDSDEAVQGLMAQHVLAGRFPLFIYGQSVGGGLEHLLAVPFFALLGPSVATLRLAALLMVLACEGLFYIAVCRLEDDVRQRLFALAAFIVCSPFFTSFNFHVYGTHLNNLLVCAGLGAVLARCRRTVLDHPVSLGLLVGLGFWVSNVVWMFVLAALVAVWVARLPFGPTPRRVCALVGGLVLAGAPRLVYWIAPGLWPQTSVAGKFAPELGGATLERARALVADAWVEYCCGALRDHGALSALAAWLALGAVVALAAATVRRALARDSAAALPTFFLLVLALSGVATVLNRRTYDSGVRYLLVGQFFLALAWARLAMRGPGAVARLRRAAGNLLFGLAVVGQVATITTPGPRPQPAPTARLLRLLDQHGCKAGMADYWIAYSLWFLSGQRFRPTPLYRDRHVAALGPERLQCHVLLVDDDPTLSPRLRAERARNREFLHARLTSLREVPRPYALARSDEFVVLFEGLAEPPRD